MSLPCDNEKRGLEFTATISNNALVPSMMLSLIFVMYASSYSDLAGKKRKVFILVALGGLILQSISSILQTVFWQWSPVLGVILNSIVGNVFGGFLSFINFIYSHLFDVTTNENRLTRVTILSVFDTIASVVGRGCVGYLLKNFGFLSSYYVCVGLQLLAVISALLFVQEEGALIEKKITFDQILSLKQIGKTFETILFPKKSKKCITSIWILLFIKLFFFISKFGTDIILKTRYRQGCPA